ncbi:hypothetical protein EDEG_02586 [Edhazardia aedis USNM 41457]|uniref:Uncharacterized protein n=1 Tax=Edhazardia aedis (strain USNM 41457) TaxID=1003232 RepID=J9D638_EDHAE|nr:hypothetical protein EDEG_02586 [Edhazardia aedis USNM 41457]|eukprot:EJW03004.1 hypothetical protein EDEG_02586 [Edhazardia aedis USNM 41457]
MKETTSRLDFSFNFSDENLLNKNVNSCLSKKDNSSDIKQKFVILALISSNLKVFLRIQYYISSVFSTKPCKYTYIMQILFPRKYLIKVQRLRKFPFNIFV